MRKVQTMALLLGLALAVLAPAFAAAGAADCSMSCCRLGLPASHAGMPDCGGRVRCSMRGCGGGEPIAALAGLPPTVLPALLAPAPLVFAAPLGQDAFRLPLRLAPDLPDRPPRAA
jgi:hypothetical protein